MFNPLISIIMPAYNAGNFIKESIQSVINQSYINWELIIINDGSLDNTEEVIKSFSDTRIRYYKQENKGVSAARNVGLYQMKGEYFTFLDADDLFPVNSLEFRINYLSSRQEVNILAGAVSFFKNSEKEIMRTWRPSYVGNPLKNFIKLDEKVFCSISFMIKRVLNKTYVFKEGMTHVEDLLFLVTIAKDNDAKYDYVNDVIYYYRATHGSAMTNLKGLENGYNNFFHNIKEMKVANLNDLVYLWLRIKRIMLLSYLKAGEYKKMVKLFRL